MRKSQLAAIAFMSTSLIAGGAFAQNVAFKDAPAPTAPNSYTCST
jgi:hypothetical protein